jgi:histidinol-phosphate aminotransferase
MTMKYGLLLPHFGEQADRDKLLRGSKRAEELGFDSLGVIDRVVYDSYEALLALAMAAAVTERTRIVIVCTPNNPTGPAVSQAELDAFIAKVPSHVVVVVDEAYLEFVRMDDPIDGVETYTRHHNVVLTRTFSKAYGLAGFRVGYAVAPAPLAGALRAVSLPFGVSHVAQAAAIASLAARDELFARVDDLVARRTELVTRLGEVGWDLPEAQGNFVWFPLGDASLDFAAACGEVGISVRPFAGDGVRVSIGEAEAFDRVVEVAARFAP